MSTEGGMKAVIAALLANLGIALSKFVAFAFTGSSSMLSEAIHSVADSGNQVLLLVGNKRSKKVADAQHQFGYGRRRYVYGFIVSIVLFLVGGLFSLYEGFHKFQHPEELSDAWIAFVVLGVAIVLEGLSFRTALRADPLVAVLGRRAAPTQLVPLDLELTQPLVFERQLFDLQRARGLGGDPHGARRCERRPGAAAGRGRRGRRGRDRREGAHDRQKPGENDGLAAVALVKALGVSTKQLKLGHYYILAKLINVIAAFVLYVLHNTAHHSFFPFRKKQALVYIIAKKIVLPDFSSKWRTV